MKPNNNTANPTPPNPAKTFLEQTRRGSTAKRKQALKALMEDSVAKANQTYPRE